MPISGKIMTNNSKIFKFAHTDIQKDDIPKSKKIIIISSKLVSFM